MESGLAARIRGDLNRTCTVYDSRGRVTSQRDSGGHTSTYDYSLPDRVTTHQPDSSGTMRTTLMVVDWLGRPSSYQDENGIQTRAVYDQAGRVSDAYRTLSGKPEAQLSHVDYDPSTGLGSALTEYASATAQRVTFDYDTAGRLIHTSRPNGVVTTATYDATRGWLSQISNARNGAELSPWTYQRNSSASSRLQSETGDGRTRSYQYDGAGG